MFARSSPAILAFLTSLLLLSGDVLAQLPTLTPDNPKCDADNCARQVEGSFSKLPLAAVRETDCARYMSDVTKTLTQYIGCVFLFQSRSLFSPDLLSF
jgi:hypothetical protein